MTELGDSLAVLKLGNLIQNPANDCEGSGLAEDYLD